MLCILPGGRWGSQCRIQQVVGGLGAYVSQVAHVALVVCLLWASVFLLALWGSVLSFHRNSFSTLNSVASVGSFFSFLQTGSANRSFTFSSYCAISKTTVAFPLSARRTVMFLSFSVFCPLSVPDSDVSVLLQTPTIASYMLQNRCQYTASLLETGVHFPLHARLSVMV